MKEELRTISLQLPTYLYAYLKEKADKECTSISFLVRKMIIEEVRDNAEKENILKDGE